MEIHKAGIQPGGRPARRPRRAAIGPASSRSTSGSRSLALRHRSQRSALACAAQAEGAQRALYGVGALRECTVGALLLFLGSGDANHFRSVGGILHVAVAEGCTGGDGGAGEGGDS